MKNAHTALDSMKKKGDTDMSAEETFVLSKFEDYHKNTHAEGGTEGNNSDEEGGEEGAQGQRVKCQQQ
jgi:hypothetical protein